MTLNSLSGLLKILAISVCNLWTILNDLTFQIYIVFYNGGLQQQVFKKYIQNILSVDRFFECIYNICFKILKYHAHSMYHLIFHE